MLSSLAKCVSLIMVAGMAGSGCGGAEPIPQERLDDGEFEAFVDSDGDGACYNEEPRTVRLSDFYAANRPGTRIIMINAAAGWCGPCMREAAELSEFAATYEPRGVVVLTAVFQDQNGQPADATFARTWAETFDLSTPTLIDTSFQTGQYFDVNTMPANMFVDAETLEILEIATGAEPGDDPMQVYRELLDYHLD